MIAATRLRGGSAASVRGAASRHGHGRITFHLPQGWHREDEWLSLRHSACGPPATAA